MNTERLASLLRRIVSRNAKFNPGWPPGWDTDSAAELIAAGVRLADEPAPPLLREALRTIVMLTEGEPGPLLATYRAEVLSVAREALAATPASPDEPAPPELQVIRDVARVLGIAYRRWREEHRHADGAWYFAGVDGPLDGALGESVRRLEAALEAATPASPAPEAEGLPPDHPDHPWKQAARDGRWEDAERLLRAATPPTPDAAAEGERR